MRIFAEKTASITDGMVRGHLATLADYQRMLGQVVRGTCTYERPEAALVAAADASVRASVRAVTEPLREHLKVVLLVGIGGSDLGTRAVYDALRGYVDSYARAGTQPRLLSFATVEPKTLQAVRTLCGTHPDPREVALVVVSKSGTTTETIVNANILFAILEEAYGKDAAVRQTIVISDADAPLARHAKEQGMGHVALPTAIGGRYSVFTAVGLVPLALLGFDIEEFCAGGVAGAQAAAPTEGVSSAAVLAALLYESYLLDLHMHDMFMWHPELETVGKWYRQLLAESLGKERTQGGRVGITPTVTLGSIDLHSVGQLVFGGPRARFTTFVAVPAVWDAEQGLAHDSPFMLDMLTGKTTKDVLSAIYGGVLATYERHALPFVRVELSALSERELGTFMAVHMASVMYVAQLLEVNAFDQPDVESYKIETRRLLHA